jgi:hypothetical protein
MKLRAYLRNTHPAVLVVDLVRAFSLLAAPIAGLLLFRWLATTDSIVAPLHRRLWFHPGYQTAGMFYRAFAFVTFLLTGAWLSSSVRTFVAFTLRRTGRDVRATDRREDKLPLPRWPYSRESFTLVLGELQDRDGTRVPSERSPNLRPRWLTLPELALYTGVFITGGIGSGKTSAVAYPALKQLLGFRRAVKVRGRDGGVRDEEWKFSGLVLDEKGDFTRAAVEFAAEWSRADDVIRLAPGGKWIWNVIYNPNLPTWAVGYQLGWIIKNFNKSASGGDPFWENAPKELVTEYLGLLDDAEGYYTLFDYLEILIDWKKQDALHEKAVARHGGDPDRKADIDRRWKAIERRRTGMSANLRGALEACARAGIDMFRFPELRRTFCPTRDEYFEVDEQSGTMRPRPNVFTGFDQVLDHGRIVGLEMPKNVYFDAAVFTQVALKSQWQDSVLRRETIGSDGRPLMPPRFGDRIGYCPTFLMADEAQQSATPKDAEFKAVCRSKRASMWELTQSHNSIRGAFGPQKAADANTYFQNSMTHVYLRQSDIDSMKVIQEECGKKLVQRTSLAITEGGRASELSYLQGGIVHDAVGVSATKTVATEEKPFVEIDELKGLPNNVAIVLPSNGDRTLPATIAYLRPVWVFKKRADLAIETSWLDWPEDLRATYDLNSIPQDVSWRGWGTEEPVDEASLVLISERLGKFVQPASIDPPALGGAARGGASPTVIVGPESEPAAAPRLVARTERSDQLILQEISSSREKTHNSPRQGDPFTELPIDEE